MSVTDQLLRNNEHYAGSFEKGHLPLPPAKGVAVVACMDARLDLHDLLGLDEGDAHVIRNAGGAITEDAIRSLVISQRLLGTREIILIHHTDCGMLTFDNPTVHDLLHERQGVDASEIDFLPFPDVAARVAESVRSVRESGLLPADYELHPFVYDVQSGRLLPVDV